MLKTISKKKILTAFVALVAFGVQTQKVVASYEISSPVALNTSNLSAFLNKYAGMSDSERSNLRNSNEYHDIVSEVKRLTLKDMMQLDLTQMLSVMKNFMRYVPQTDAFAKVIDRLYLDYVAQINVKFDVRNVARFWDNSGADSLKNSFNMMKEVSEGTLSYNWVKCFYDDLSKHLMNFIVEHKDGAEFASEAIKSGKFYSYHLSNHAKSKVKDWEKRAESNAEANAAAEMKRYTMEELGKKYETADTALKFSEQSKLQSIFDEKFSEEKGKLDQIYGGKSFEELVQAQDALYTKKKSYNYWPKHSLNTQWSEAQLEVIEGILLKKLLSKPELIDGLARIANANVNASFHEKIKRFVSSESSEIRDYYIKEYGEKSYDELKKLEKIMMFGAMDHRTFLRFHVGIKDIQLEAVKHWVDKKSPDKLLSPEAEKANYKSKLPSPELPSPKPSLPDLPSPELPSPKPLPSPDKPSRKPLPSPEPDPKPGVSALDEEELSEAMIKILPKQLHSNVDYFFNDILNGNRDRGANAKGKTVRSVKAERLLKESLFKALLKLKPSAVSNRLETETKYSILRQFNQLAFQEGQQQDSHEDMIFDQVSMDLGVAPLVRFYNALSGMYADDHDLEEVMKETDERFLQAIEDAFKQPLSKDLKKQVLLEAFHSIGGVIDFFSDDDGGVFNTMKNMAKQAKLTPVFIRKNLEISGMDKNDEDYDTIMTFTKRLGAPDRKKGNNQKSKLPENTKKKVRQSDETTSAA